MTDWISVEDRLPEADGLVLIHAPSVQEGILPYIDTAWYEKITGWCLIFKWQTRQVTHWQPLPEPPKEAE